MVLWDTSYWAETPSATSLRLYLIMKIAQIAPLAESCPPRTYGGTERMVSYLTEELVAQGHEVTLFASGDSVTAAELVPCTERALNLDPEVTHQLPYAVEMLDKVTRRADEFDAMHFHIDYIHFPMVRHFASRTLTTLHWRLDLYDLRSFYGEFPHIPLVSISDAQRRGMAGNVNWAGTVHHGLPVDLLPFSAVSTGGYLAFLGRIVPEKGLDHAIRIAAAAGLPLKIAARIEAENDPYWRNVIEPLIEASLTVEYTGEIDEAQKASFLGNARALLFPIDWPEPFGLVMIEAMACGTPVIAYGRGAAPEVIDDGVTGFIVSTVDEAAAAIGKLDRLDRRRIRAVFEKRFTAERMARDYLALYARHAEMRLRA